MPRPVKKVEFRYYAQCKEAGRWVTVAATPYKRDVNWLLSALSGVIMDDNRARLVDMKTGRSYTLLEAIKEL